MTRKAQDDMGEFVTVGDTLKMPINKISQRSESEQLYPDAMDAGDNSTIVLIVLAFMLAGAATRSTPPAATDYGAHSNDRRRRSYP